MGRDANHETIAKAFRRTAGERGVIDLHTIGDGCPDLLVGYAGTERLIETKVPPELPGRRAVSTRCAGCGKTYAMHKKRPERTCGEFERQYRQSPNRGGVVDRRQKKFHREWPGHTPLLCRTEEDVEDVLEDMRAEGRILREMQAEALA